MKKELKKKNETKKKINIRLVSFIVISDLTVTYLTCLKNKPFYGNRLKTGSWKLKNQQTSKKN